MERLLKRDPPAPARPAHSFWLKLYATLLHWQRNLRTRRQLARLDARQLADAGISEAQRQAELSKPFWD
jgi:uncharacterized protein YjiS (DUF1127 family)